jgi:hypothetical protein
MAQKTDAELLIEANVIGNETTTGGNTADRVRDHLTNITESKINNDKIDTAATLDTASKTVPGRDAVKTYIAALVTTVEDDVTLANGVTEIDADSGDIQRLTISENKVINSVINMDVGETILLVLDGTFSMSFTTIDADVSGEYNAGEENRVYIYKYQDTGGEKFLINFDNSLTTDFPTTSTGSAIQFDRDRFYGESAAITGALTLNDTGLVKGTTAVVRHNDSTNPFLTSDAEFIVIGGEYVIDVDNYIYMHAWSATVIHCNIVQHP